MANYTKVKTKKFKKKSEATSWAKDEKKKNPPNTPFKWETNRTSLKEMPWEAVIYKVV